MGVKCCFFESIIFQYIQRNIFVSRGSLLKLLVPGSLFSCTEDCKSDIINSHGVDNVEAIANLFPDLLLPDLMSASGSISAGPLHPSIIH
jgi:hypothetical protein